MKVDPRIQTMIDQLVSSLSQELCIDENYIRTIIKEKLMKEVRYWIKNSSYFDLSSFMKKYKNKVYAALKTLYKKHPDLNEKRPYLIDTYYVFKNLVCINLIMMLKYPRSFIQPCVEEIENEMLKPYFRKHKNETIKFSDYANSTFKGNKVGPTLKRIFTRAHKNCINTVKW